LEALIVVLLTSSMALAVLLAAAASASRASRPAWKARNAAEEVALAPPRAVGSPSSDSPLNSGPAAGAPPTPPRKRSPNACPKPVPASQLNGAIIEPPKVGERKTLGRLVMSS
jgi:hypothetical protein